MPGMRLARHVAASAIAIGLASGAVRAQVMIVGNDEKVTFGADGKTVQHPPGKDSLSIIDVSKPDALRIIATLYRRRCQKKERRKRRVR